MIEALAVGARALGVLATAHLIGSGLFLVLAGGRDAAPTLRAWQGDWQRRLVPAAILLIGALIASLWAQAAALGGGEGQGLALMTRLARDSAYGHVWLTRLAVAAALLGVCLAALRWHAALVPATGLATTVAALSALSAHAAGTERAPLLMALHVVHLVSLSAWFGGLLPWISLARRAASESSLHASASAALQRFSRLSLACIAAVVLSGTALAWTFIDDQGDLFGTRYGLLLCAKLVLLALALAIANHLRRRWLPSLATRAAYADGAAYVQREAALGLAVLVLGAALAQTTPAVHDQPTWRLPFRLSLAAALDDPASTLGVQIGAFLLVLGLGLTMALRTRAARRGASVLLAVGIASSCWALAVPAFPSTFLRSPVPYLTLSISQGRQHFEAQCVACHGAGGLGDGVLAATLRKPPANLSEPHTALHTPGDMYWWFTHGMPAGPMPGFAEVLDEESRWDLVNFLRTFSQGFQARVLGPNIVPRQPWIGAPNFYYATADGGRAELKDLRGQRAALLVFTDANDPRSLDRAAEVQALESPTLAVLTPTEADVWDAYQFLTRTRADRGRADHLGMPRRHAEFLLDRFGYLRARWIPADEADGGEQAFDVRAQAEALAREPQLLPPPDLHLH